MKRAAQRLADQGFLEVFHARVLMVVRNRGPSRGAAERLKMVVRRTPLGQAVVDRLRDDLACGRRIRWGEHIAAVAGAVMARSQGSGRAPRTSRVEQLRLLLLPPNTATPHLRARTRFKT